MSLSKQMILGFLVVLLIVFLGTLWVTVQNTRSYVQQQLASHAQDTATSLGLSISPYVGDSNGTPVIETMMQAIFDRGYYSTIELLDNNEQSLLLFQNPTHTNNVPSWFVSLFPLSAPHAMTELNDGWTIQGQLVVVSNAGYGYTQLYENAIESLYLFIMSFCVALAFIWYLITQVLSKPMNQLLNQMDGISQQQFNEIKEIPKTPELRKILLAMNSMSRKLSKLFYEITQQSERFRKFAFTDLVTGVGNRRAFELTIRKLLDDDSGYSSGFLFITKATSLGSVHSQLGGRAGDEYLSSISEIIKGCVKTVNGEFGLYRVNGSDFALVVENIDEEAAKALAIAIVKSAKRIEKSEHVSGTAHVGVTEFNSDSKLQELLEKADSALSIAIESDSSWEIAANAKVTYSNGTWRSIIQNILENGHCDFVHQPVLAAADKTTVIYNEWFARICDSKTGEAVPMAQLVPASIRLNYSIALDKLIVANVLKLAANSQHHVGLNISRFALLDEAFSQWIINQFESNIAIARSITLEIPERALVQDAESISVLVRTLKKLGVRIAIEHYGAQLAGITHLRHIIPDYLKIDGRFTRGIDQHEDNQLFVSSLISIAKGLSIEIIAEMVETEEEYLWLHNAGVDYIQGYYTSKPSSIS